MGANRISERRWIVTKCDQPQKILEAVQSINLAGHVVVRQRIRIPSLKIRIGLIGDYDDSVVAHIAIPKAILLVQQAANIDVDYCWLSTDAINEDRLHEFHGLWCVPASPYRDPERAIRAIQFARENRLPFIGSCGGFQHAIIEYARNVLAITDASHAESHPEAANCFISPLACALVEETERVTFSKRSHLRRAYNCESSNEAYHCRYGLNPAFQTALTNGHFAITAINSNGEVRALELRSHPFFVLTLFQSERKSLQGVVPPIVAEFIRHCHRCAVKKTGLETPFHKFTESKNE